ncbi:hypothetical protein [Candidatus Cardinium hertigii]|uniref:Uncharacterized protein n=1 Tax=Candidatus Cardinium hertigii TaxID=247481 RepID=A0A2Z3L6X3_9BACT|nr:hypothetical protein [Candidatus Cardinium hertigii]AWN81403.1 hypothetical protein DK880_00065 [Candidatus Cardinium hertigii]
MGYVCHFDPIWHMKFCGSFTNKNLLTVYNTYHWNLYNRYEFTYFNFLVGGQGNYKFDHQLSISAFLASISLLASAAADVPVYVSPIRNSLLELHAN